MELLDLHRSLDPHLGRPLTRGALTVFPVWSGRAVPEPGFDLATAHLAVDERAGSAVVAELVVRNDGARPVLVCEGELLEGGHQHRVAAATVLVRAGDSVVLDVHCVEQGRWHGGSAHARRGRRAPLRVRARGAGGQSAVWAEIGRIEEQHGGGATCSLLDATRSVEDRAARLVAGVRPLAGQTGVLVGVAGQPLAVEAFDSPDVLAQAWDALLHAAAVDAVDRPPVPTPGRRARRFLDGVLRARAVGRRRAGLATTTVAASPSARLEATTWQRRVVHAVAVNPRHELVAS